MSAQIRFRLLIARTDVDGYAVVYAMDDSVIDAAGEDEWDDQASLVRAGWPDEYDYAAVTVSIPVAHVEGAFPRVVEVEGVVAGAE